MTVAVVNHCTLPEDLYYLVERHVWARPDGDLVTVGLSDVAQNLARTIISVTLKSPGRMVAKGKNAATVESGKWVGPVPAPVSGEIVEVNEALRTSPATINADPYGAGWIARIRATDWAGDSADLATGEPGIAAYREFLDREGIACGG
ncbi:MAG: glycine cleavage system protein GcvH [Actinomycetes bacterium]